MGKLIDLTGQKFGKLTAIEYHGEYKWLCICDCGKEKIVRSSHLINGHTKSCGCISIKHHQSKTKTYHIWQGMKKRCNNPKDKSYKNYGGRGITICSRWLNKENGFINFLNDMGECPKGYELDRIDNNQLVDGYSPNNCRWTTKKQQNRNKRNNVFIPYKNKIQCRTDLANEHNMNEGTLRYRLDHGKSIKEAIETPVKSRK